MTKWFILIVLVSVGGVLAVQNASASLTGGVLIGCAGLIMAFFLAALIGAFDAGEEGSVPAQRFGRYYKYCWREQWGKPVFYFAIAAAIYSYWGNYPKVILGCLFWILIAPFLVMLATEREKIYSGQYKKDA